VLLLHYHPDIRGGHDEVIALMFDMNQLWERYILKILRHAAPADWTVEGQSKALFWQADGLPEARLKPDILLRGPDRTIVLDTKWKVLHDDRPSDADLRQLFAYQHRWGCAHGFLVYPDLRLQVREGHFEDSPLRLHVMGVDVLNAEGLLNADLGIHIWQKVMQTKQMP
jgi:5-methylcytosine-specific restriction enzyme subunit McrC